MARLFVLQEDVTDLGTIPVRQDDVVAFLQKFGEERAGRLDPTALGRCIAGARRQKRIAANGHDELRHATPSRGRPALFWPVYKKVRPWKWAARTPPSRVAAYLFIGRPHRRVP